MSHAKRRPAIQAALTLLQSPDLAPAGRAYLIGLLADVVPAILKLLVKFARSHTRRIAQLTRRLTEEQLPTDRATTPAERAAINAKAGHSATRQTLGEAVYALPSLLLSAVRSVLSAATNQHGLALCGALTVIVWRLLESLLIKALPRGQSAQASAACKLRTQVSASFFAATTAAVIALHYLGSGLAPVPRRSNSQGKRDRGLGRSPSNSALLFRKLQAATPLAPGGHFMSRLTNLSIPVSPNDPGNASPKVRRLSNAGTHLAPPPGLTGQVPASPDLGKEREVSEDKPVPSPTLEFTLSLLVRAIDTATRVWPVVTAGAAGSTATATAATAAAAAARKTAGSPSPAQHNIVRRILGSIGSWANDQRDGLLFVVCCAEIMYSWFYEPQRLSPMYNKWITNLASMDERCLLALRCHRIGKPYNWRYGTEESLEVGSIALMSGLAESLGYPYEWGDPTRVPQNAAEAKVMRDAVRAANRKRCEAQRIDFDSLSQIEQDEGFILAGAAGPRGRGEMGGVPCEVVHCGITGSSCYADAGLRWLRGFKASLFIYVPVHLAPRLLFAPKAFFRHPFVGLWRVFKGAARSSAFLATFIASIWFMVCMVRSEVCPRLFPNVSMNVWDHGFGEILGSWTCGWSVFLEEKRKRAEMALYVAPRALFALIESVRPGWLNDRRHLSSRITERMLFGVSTGLLLTTAQFRPDLLRGIASILAWVVRDPSMRRVRVTGDRAVPVRATA